MSRAELFRGKSLLLVGMARSGTSWIGKIFDSHPATLYKHEPDRSIPDVPMIPRLEDAEHYREPLARFIDKLPDLNALHIAGMLPVFPKSYRSSVAQNIHRLSVLGVAAGSFLRKRLPVLQCVSTTNDGIHLVWKSIDSLSRLGLILRLQENWRAIHILRHPCATISSTLRGEAQGKFASSVSPSEDYGIIRMLVERTGKPRGLTLDHLAKLHSVERMTWIWVLTNEKALADSRDMNRCTVVRYEDVCADPIRYTKQLFRFAGLSWNDQTATFIEQSTLGAKPTRFDRITQNAGRYYGVFKDPVRSATKWKTEMTPDDIERVYSVLRQSDLIRQYPEVEMPS